MSWEIIVVGILCGLITTNAQIRSPMLSEKFSSYSTPINVKSSSSMDEANEIIPFEVENVIVHRACEGKCLDSFVGAFFCDKLDSNAYCPNEESCCLNNDEITDRSENELESRKSTKAKKEEPEKKLTLRRIFEVLPFPLNKLFVLIMLGIHYVFYHLYIYFHK